jgi:hypothetical protein
VYEVRWLGFGEQRMTKGGIFLYSGRDEDGDDRNGVGILLIKKAKNSLIEWHSVSERITAHFKAKFLNSIILQCYAPAENSEIESNARVF